MSTDDAKQLRKKLAQERKSSRELFNAIQSALCQVVGPGETLEKVEKDRKDILEKAFSKYVKDEMDGMK